MKLKVGSFARIGQVTVQMLRHYDELGLLKPMVVDIASGYRYYTVDQLPYLHRILALKDLGFSLEQIAHLLEDDLPFAELRGMLRMKQNELRAPTHRQADKIKAGFLDQVEIFLLDGQAPFAFVRRFEHVAQVNPTTER